MTSRTPATTLATQQVTGGPSVNWQGRAFAGSNNGLSASMRRVVEQASGQSLRIGQTEAERFATMIGVQDSPIYMENVFRQGMSAPAISYFDKHRTEFEEMLIRDTTLDTLMNEASWIIPVLTEVEITPIQNFKVTQTWMELDLPEAHPDGDIPRLLREDSWSRTYGSERVHKAKRLNLALLFDGDGAVYIQNIIRHFSYVFNIFLSLRCLSMVIAMGLRNSVSKAQWTKLTEVELNILRFQQDATFLVGSKNAFDFKMVMQTRLGPGMDVIILPEGGMARMNNWDFKRIEQIPFEYAINPAFISDYMRAAFGAGADTDNVQKATFNVLGQAYGQVMGTSGKDIFIGVAPNFNPDHTKSPYELLNETRSFLTLSGRRTSDRISTDLQPLFFDINENKMIARFDDEAVAHIHIFRKMGESLAYSDLSGFDPDGYAAETYCNDLLKFCSEKEDATKGKNYVPIGIGGSNTSHLSESDQNLAKFPIRDRREFLWAVRDEDNPDLVAPPEFVGSFARRHLPTWALNNIAREAKLKFSGAPAQFLEKLISVLRQLEDRDYNEAYWTEVATKNQPWLNAQRTAAGPFADPSQAALQPPRSMATGFWNLPTNFNAPFEIWSAGFLAGCNCADGIRAIASANIPIAFSALKTQCADVLEGWQAFRSCLMRYFPHTEIASDERDGFDTFVRSCISDPPRLFMRRNVGQLDANDKTWSELFFGINDARLDNNRATLLQLVQTISSKKSQVDDIARIVAAAAKVNNLEGNNLEGGGAEGAVDAPEDTMEITKKALFQVGMGALIRQFLTANPEMPLSDVSKSLRSKTNPTFESAKSLIKTDFANADAVKARCDVVIHVQNIAESQEDARDHSSYVQTPFVASRHFARSLFPAWSTKKKPFITIGDPSTSYSTPLLHPQDQATSNEMAAFLQVIARPDFNPAGHQSRHARRFLLDRTRKGSPRSTERQPDPNRRRESTHQNPPSSRRVSFSSTGAYNDRIHLGSEMEAINNAVAQGIEAATNLTSSPLWNNQKLHGEWGTRASWIFANTGMDLLQEVLLMALLFYRVNDQSMSYWMSTQNPLGRFVDINYLALHVVRVQDIALASQKNMALKFQGNFTVPNADPARHLVDIIPSIQYTFIPNNEQNNAIIRGVFANGVIYGLNAQIASSSDDMNLWLQRGANRSHASWWNAARAENIQNGPCLLPFAQPITEPLEHINLDCRQDFDPFDADSYGSLSEHWSGLEYYNAITGLKYLTSAGASWNDKLRDDPESAYGSTQYGRFSVLTDMAHRGAQFFTRDGANINYFSKGSGELGDPTVCSTGCREAWFGLGVFPAKVDIVS